MNVTLNLTFEDETNTRQILDDLSEVLRQRLDYHGVGDFGLLTSTTYEKTSATIPVGQIPIRATRGN